MRDKGKEGGGREREMKGRRKEWKGRERARIFKEIESCSGMLCSFYWYFQKAPEMYFTGEKLGTNSL